MRLWIIAIFCLLLNGFGLAAFAGNKDQIWSPSQQRFISEKQLIQKLRQSRYIILGENHDNPAHHRLQAHLMKQVLKSGRRPAVVFEMLDRDKQNAITIFKKRFVSTAPISNDPLPQRHDATGLDVLLDWQNSGWPDWQMYKPLFDIAFLNELPIGASNFSRYDIGQMHQKGFDGMPTELASILRPLLDKKMPDPLLNVLSDDIREGHCNMLPDNLIPRFVDIQRARDAAFAYAMIEQETKHQTDGAILITGNGHARREIAVPRYLNDLREDARVIAIGLIARSESAAPDLDNEDLKYFDYVWFTEEVARPEGHDPCDVFRK